MKRDKKSRFGILIALTLAILYGCAGMAPAERSAQREFTFDFSVKGKPQRELWRNARDFFAEAYGDSRAVFRIMDENDGTIIGRGMAQWALVSNNCHTEYHVRFAAKEEKARLQFELIEGVPALSDCQGWPWPSKDGYDQIVTSFKNTANRLETVRNIGVRVHLLITCGTFDPGGDVPN